MGELTALPRTPSWILGVRPTSKGREKRERVGREGEGREGST